MTTENRSNINKSNIDYFDFLKLLSAFFVIIIHIISPLLNNYSELLTSTATEFLFFFRLLSNWPVPIFTMITGALLLNKEKDISINIIFFKYIPRILLALLIFGVFYSWLEIIFTNKTFQVIQIIPAFFNTLNNKSWDHMWYLYMIVGLYLCLPIFRAFTSYVNKSNLLTILTILFLFTSIYPYLTSYTNFSIGFEIPITSIYVFFLFLGFYLHNYQTWNTATCLIIYTILITIYILASKNFIFTFDNELSYSTPTTALMSINTFILIKNIVKKGFVLQNLAKLTFAIYLIHPLFINIILKLLSINPLAYSLKTVILVQIITVPVISLLFSLLLYKVPVLKKYVL